MSLLSLGSNFRMFCAQDCGTLCYWCPEGGTSEGGGDLKEESVTFVQCHTIYKGPLNV